MSSNPVEIPGHETSQFGPVVIDANGHLMGRLAAVVAKELLNGRQITVVRCEKLLISGSLARNKLKYHDYLRKRCLVNPARGPFHYRAPSKMFFKTVRGMVPHKRHRGAAALNRLKVFEGVPTEHELSRRVLVPTALRRNCLRSHRKFTVVGRLAQEVGWKYAHVIRKNEEDRTSRLYAVFRRAKTVRDIRKNHTVKIEALKDVAEELKKMGYLNQETYTTPTRLLKKKGTLKKVVPIEAARKGVMNMKELKEMKK